MAACSTMSHGDRFTSSRTSSRVAGLALNLDKFGHDLSDLGDYLKFEVNHFSAIHKGTKEILIQ